MEEQDTSKNEPASLATETEGKSKGGKGGKGGKKGGKDKGGKGKHADDEKEDSGPQEALQVIDEIWGKKEPLGITKWQVFLPIATE